MDPEVRRVAIRIMRCTETEDLYQLMLDYDMGRLKPNSPPGSPRMGNYRGPQNAGPQSGYKGNHYNPNLDRGFKNNYRQDYNNIPTQGNDPYHTTSNRDSRDNRDMRDSRDIRDKSGNSISSGKPYYKENPYKRKRDFDDAKGGYNNRDNNYKGFKNEQVFNKWTSSNGSNKIDIKSDVKLDDKERMERDKDKNARKMSESILNKSDRDEIEKISQNFIGYVKPHNMQEKMERDHEEREREKANELKIEKQIENKEEQNKPTLGHQAHLDKKETGSFGLSRGFSNGEND